MKILIPTDYFHTIENEILLHIESSGYRITVQEIGPCTQVIQHAQSDLNDPSKGASNGVVPGFEDLQDDMSSENDVANSDSTRFHLIRQGTSCFSQSGFSEEILKITQHLSTSGEGQSTKIPEYIEQPPGFEKGTHHQSAIFHTWEPAMKLGDRADDALTRVAEVRVSDSLEGGKTPEDKLADVNDADSSVPATDEIGIKTIGDEIQIVQETQNLNDIERLEVNNNSLGSRIEESLDSPTKTKTACFSHNGSFHEVEQPRQQAVECERSMEIGGAHQLEGGDGPEQPPGFEIQVNTNFLQKLERSEAKMEQSGLIQIAKESLEVGKFLGLTVVDKEEAAFRRITGSLKKEIERKASKQ
ncbi:hypothetical protein Cgig2_032201 [Carnegiea gigantea]|uniref:Uncharacterized protein n=1 Tax=Carnegiea gigantea TaxID=171969 RepID=A0A9Q1QD53_9CARY|nr:hypothetical protein Cgig2_032201 [Carnegiea gigantea]